MLDGCCGPTLTFPTCPECQTLYMPRSSPRLLAAVLSLLVLAPAAATTAPSGPLRADKLDKSVGITAEMLLGAYHYASETGRSDLHARTLTQYIDALDPSHSVFLAADVARFTAANEGPPGASLDLAFDVQRTFVLRVRERMDFVETQVGATHDYTLAESRLLPDEDTAFPRTDAESHERWRLRVKDELLRLQLAGGDDVDPVEVLTERYSNFRRDVEEMEAVDVREAWISAIARCYGPHSEYYAPMSRENFDINIGNTFEGIGASLSRRGEHTKIEELIPGGPAQRSKKLVKGDRIVGVGQATGAVKNVVGLKLDNVVKLIRGSRGTAVRLRILPAGASDAARTKVIRLVRDKVELKERDASLEVRELQTSGGKTVKVGMINVPAFYIDGDAVRRGDPNANRVSTDVEKLLAEAKEGGARGVLIDMRFNGGGSLDEAVALAGLFVDAGPIVQVRDSFDKVDVLEDPDPKLAYGDPVVVLTGPFTASAAEIFAAALQDYGRGLVVGTPATHGKGTVQSFYGLDDQVQRYVGSLPEEGAGALKLTMWKFYRVNGGSTQLKGVEPDIILPSRWDGAELGERTLDGALAWDSIDAVKHKQYTDINAERVQQWSKASRERVAADAGFAAVGRISERMREDRAIKKISLNRAERQAEMEQEEKESEATRAALGLTEEDDLPDVSLEEGLRILGDVLTSS